MGDVSMKSLHKSIILFAFMATGVYILFLGKDILGNLLLSLGIVIFIIHSNEEIEQIVKKSMKEREM